MNGDMHEVAKHHDRQLQQQQESKCEELKSFLRNQFTLLVSTIRITRFMLRYQSIVSN